MQRASANARASGKKIVFVPTMGALHEGHQTLVRRARRYGDCVVVSIFVNPIQFGPNEDFKRYPRDLSGDLAKLRSCRADIVFVPGVSTIYPKGDLTTVEVRGVTEGLCGASRPGHFKGVATVVLKLLNLVRPDIALFGQKDYQQFLALRQMVRDLHLPLSVVGVETVREPDGLAMSSRNIYLSQRERVAALALPKALHSAQSMVQRGLDDARELKTMVLKMLTMDPQIRIDYVEICDARILKPISRIEGPARLLAAIWVGKTRLIDNVALTLRRRR